MDTLTIYLGDDGLEINRYSLPNLPNYGLGPLIGSECDTPQNAIQQISVSDAVFIFPNPATESITISGSNSGYLLSQLQSVSIFDMNGRMILELKSLPADGTIDIGDIPNGLYTVSIMLNNETITEKLMILK